MTQEPPSSRSESARSRKPGVRDWTIIEVTETGSTNDDLLRAAERGDVVERTVRRTDHQTAGRGRLDRRWDAPPGTNLLASMYVLVSDPVDLMHRVGLAVIGAIEAIVGRAVPGLGLKWPNDVLFDGRKLAGVLAQRSTSAPGIVVGFGVNVAWSPPDTATAKVSDIVDVAPPVLLRAVLGAFDALPDDVGAAYTARLTTIGQQVRVVLPGDRVVTGTAQAVDVAGRLVVIDGGGDEHHFDVGDVIHLRPADP